MKKKLAIVTLFDNNNFGNKLQNYAAQVLFERMGFEVATLQDWELTHPRFTLKRLIFGVAHTLLYFTEYEKKRRRKLELSRMRRECIGSFSKQYIKVGPAVKYSSVPENLKDQYDYFAAGSDQVWHCWTGRTEELEYFLLSFADPGQRITVSPSFGFDKIPPNYVHTFREGLQGFQYLSCREESGRALIKELTSQDAVVLPDPTMLIDVDEWLKILRRPANFAGGDYILVYMLGGLSGDAKDAVYCLARIKNFQVIDLLDQSGEFYTSTRPDEFLYWIRNARITVTDSFHACVFSILFERPFSVGLRKDAPGMENRIDTLLQKFSLEERKFDNVKHIMNDMDIELIDAELLTVDYKNAPEIIETGKKRAVRFYEKCLNTD